jgi:formamidopyrimidine-DNA glycosylase
LTLKLDTGELLVLDVRNGGRLRRMSAREAVVKGTQVVITFTQGGQLRLLDGAGGLDAWVTTREELLEDVPELAELGLDPLEEPISWTTFGHLLLARRARLKAILTDPSAVSGIGPVYSDEILHAAGLRHDRLSDGLTSQEMRRLYRALVETLHEAAKHRGSTLADGVYGDLAGRPGDYQGELKVYERDGQACKRCRDTVTKARVGGKVIYYCPACQV